MRKGTAKSKTGKHLINYSELGRRLGVSRFSVCALFRGETKNMKRIEQALDLIVEELCIADRCWRKTKLRLERKNQKKR